MGTRVQRDSILLLLAISWVPSPLQSLHGTYMCPCARVCMRTEAAIHERSGAEAELSGRGEAARLISYEQEASLDLRAPKTVSQ